MDKSVNIEVLLKAAEFIEQANRSKKRFSLNILKK
jgi:hypothetical protein